MRTFARSIFVFFFALTSVSEAVMWTESDLEVLLQKSPATGKPVDSMEELIPLLPTELRSNFTFVFSSRSPFQNNITPRNPRVILFSKDAKIVLTFIGLPGAEGADVLESISFDEVSSKFKMNARVLPAAIRRGAPAKISTKSCQSCHGADPRPLFDAYPAWPGFYGAIQDTVA